MAFDDYDRCYNTNSYIIDGRLIAEKWISLNLHTQSFTILWPIMFQALCTSKFID